MDSAKITKNNYGYKITLFNQIPRVLRDGHIPMSKEDKLNSSMARARKMIREYSFNNLWDYFVTITISPKVYDRYKDKEKFMRRILRYFSNYRSREDSYFRYLLVPELHDDGAVHFHGFVQMAKKDVLTFRYYDHKHHRAIYTHDYLLEKFGRCQFVAIKQNTVASSNYITKYLVKGQEKIFDRYYYVSKGMNRDIVVYSGLGLGGVIKDVATNLQLNVRYGEYSQTIYLNNEYYEKFIDDLIPISLRFGYEIPPFVFLN